jgi:hypothetical protein
LLSTYPGSTFACTTEQRREEYYKKLWSRDLKIEDLDALDTDGDGEGKFTSFSISSSYLPYYHFSCVLSKSK